MKLIRQIKHVKVLHIGSWLIKTLKAEEGSSSLFLNCKCLTLDGAYFDGHLPGIASAIHYLPLLDKLDINFPLNQLTDSCFQSRKTAACLGLNDCRNKYCLQSDGAVFNRSVSNLKTVKIIGLSERYGYSKCVFDFLEFILKNGRALENIILVLADCGERFCFEVLKKLLSLPRGCSPMATIELCSTCSNMCNTF